MEKHSFCCHYKTTQNLSPCSYSMCKFRPIFLNLDFPKLHILPRKMAVTSQASQSESPHIPAGFFPQGLWNLGTTAPSHPHHSPIPLQICGDFLFPSITQGLDSELTLVWQQTRVWIKVYNVQEEENAAHLSQCNHLRVPKEASKHQA